MRSYITKKESVEEQLPIEQSLSFNFIQEPSRELKAAVSRTDIVAENTKIIDFYPRNINDKEA